MAIQWGSGLTDCTNGTASVIFPISATAFCGVASDAGESPIFYSFCLPNTVYGRNEIGKASLGAFAYIVICK